MNELSLIIGQVVLLLTTLAGFYVQSKREERKRQWDVQDRENERLERREDARSIADRVKDSALKLREKVETQHQAVIDEIQTNTKVSTDAFTEANNLNAKLLDMARQIRDLRAHPILAFKEQRQIDAIDERTSQHTEQLADIQQKVGHE